MTLNSRSRHYENWKVVRDFTEFVLLLYAYSSIFDNNKNLDNAKAFFIVEGCDSHALCYGLYSDSCQDGFEPAICKLATRDAAYDNNNMPE